MLEDEITVMIIDVLELEDVTPGDIDPSEALFGEGLGLDSIDALELGLALKKRYELKIDIENDDMKQHFFSVASLAKFVEERRQV
ncbi:phosphopantetheine-binding protein [Pelagibius marinus]|uniref:phosphopantetheine-binding protein n=1 Tax=Pelagibius marinus TaxID=2762760 RepID=UPI001872D9C7|nr:phosphopantetheine-binding protein [Pelagibius marinus]